MTEQLYLADAYKRDAKAKIVELGNGYIILDQTIFYPQGGGQPSDKGTIKSESGELHVKSVEYNSGAIKHIGNLSGEFNQGQQR